MLKREQDRNGQWRSGAAGEGMMAEQTRAYKLKIYPTRSKSEIAGYALNRAKVYLKKLLATNLFDGRKITTQGQGQLFNQMSHQARGKAKAIKESSKETGNKWNVPENPKVSLPCKLEKAASTSFDYWICVPNQWEKSKVVRIPANGHKALKNGWKLSNWAHLTETGEILVNVSKEVAKAAIPSDCIGVDVGIKRAVTTSDGFCGKDLSGIIRKDRKSAAERSRQRTLHGQKIPQKKKINKTKIKQELNRYAKDCINRVKGDPSLGMALESSRILAKSLLTTFAGAGAGKWGVRAGGKSGLYFVRMPGLQGEGRKNRNLVPLLG